MTGGIDAAVRAERDAAVLAAVHAACFPDAWSAEAFESLLASPGCFALAAHEAAGSDDVPVLAMILARVAGDDCEIITIGVRPQVRRLGLAILLLEHAAARAIGLGASRQVLEVGVENGPALRLYARLGFAECGRRPGYYGGAGDDAVVLARDLRKPAGPTTEPARHAQSR